MLYTNIARKAPYYGSLHLPAHHQDNRLEAAPSWVRRSRWRPMPTNGGCAGSQRPVMGGTISDLILGSSLIPELAHLVRETK